MKTRYYAVAVTAPTAEQADRVIAERLAHEEDYGYTYAIMWSPENRDDDGQKLDAAGCED